jgi:hypothetical protein
VKDLRGRALRVRRLGLVQTRQPQSIHCQHTTTMLNDYKTRCFESLKQEIEHAHCKTYENHVVGVL